MSDTRCEPPPELRSVDGWHWVDADRPIVCMWQWDPWNDTGAWKMPGSIIWGPDSAHRHGYRYLSPVATSAEVEALRVERDAFAQQAGECSGGYQTLEREVTTLLARVARLEQALHSADALLCADGYTVTHPVVQAIASALTPETPEKDSPP